MTELATPPTARSFLSLANYRDTHLFAIGGSDPVNLALKLASVEMYNVD